MQYKKNIFKYRNKYFVCILLYLSKYLYLALQINYSTICKHINLQTCGKII